MLLFTEQCWALRGECSDVLVCKALAEAARKGRRRRERWGGSGRFVVYGDDRSEGRRGEGEGGEGVRADGMWLGMWEGGWAGWEGKGKEGGMGSMGDGQCRKGRKRWLVRKEDGRAGEVTMIDESSDDCRCVCLDWDYRKRDWVWLGVSKCEGRWCGYARGKGRGGGRSGVGGWWCA